MLRGVCILLRRAFKAISNSEARPLFRSTVPRRDGVMPVRAASARYFVPQQ